jgi:hypothetical protein
MVLTVALVVLLVLSAPLDLWLPSLDPKPMWLKVWLIFLIGVGCAFAAFMVFIIIMYVVYKIVHGIPLIGPSIADNIPIFSDLRRAGLFDLVGNSIFVVVYGDGVLGKLGGLANVWVTFMFNSGAFIRELMGGGGDMAEQPRVNTGLPPDGVPANEGVETEENTLTEAERQEVNNAYNQCMRESMVEVYPEDTNMARAAKQVQNKGYKTMCSIQRMSTYLRVLLANRRMFVN